MTPYLSFISSFSIYVCIFSSKSCEETLTRAHFCMENARLIIALHFVWEILADFVLSDFPMLRQNLIGWTSEMIKRFAMPYVMQNKP